MSARRLPVYLLIDCSESMAGTAIEEVSRGVQSLVTTLRGNPLALETAHLSVITFARYAKQVVPLTDIMQFTPPKFTVHAGTALGAALKLLMQCLQREVVKNTSTTRGDYKPLVFLMTDGQATDDWEPAAAALRAANNPKIANIYAIGCGPDVDADSLRQITEIVLTMQDAMSPEAWRKMFVWLSASVNTASTQLGGNPDKPAIDMPVLPMGLELASGSTGYHDPTPRQVFLQARCQRTGRPYLMRFARQGRNDRYVAIAAHELETVEEGDDDLLPSINSSQLDGCPSCPYCENPVAAVCQCGAVFCDTVNSTGPVACPVCKAELTSAGGGNFDIQRSKG